MTHPEQLEWYQIVGIGLGAGAATVTMLLGLIVLLAKWRNVTFIVPMKKGDDELKAEFEDQLNKIKDMLGANGTSVIEALQQQIHAYDKAARQRDEAMHARLNHMAAGEMLHRTQGFAIAKMQHAAAQQHGLVGWPDPEHFRGMLGVDELKVAPPVDSDE